jgi:hypothetical protein
MKKTKIIFLFLIIIGFLMILYGCNTNAPGGVKVQISVSDGNRNLLETNEEIEFYVSLNLPIVDIGKFFLYVQSVNPASPREKISPEDIKISKVDSQIVKIIYTPKKAGRYSFSASFSQIGSNKEIFSEESLTFDIKGKNAYIESMTLVNNNAKILDRDGMDDEELIDYPIVAVIKQDISPELLFSIKTEDHNNLTLLFSSEGVSKEVKVNDPSNMRITLDTFPSTGYYYGKITLYDSERANPIDIFDEKEILFIVTNDTIPPEIIVLESDRMTGNNLFLESSAENVMVNFGFLESQDMNNIGLYRTTITVNGERVHNKIYSLGNHEDYVPITLSTSRELNAVNLRAEDLAGNIYNRSVNVYINKIQIKGNVTATTSQGRQIDSGEQIPFGSKINFECSVTLNLDSEIMNNATLNYYVRDDVSGKIVLSKEGLKQYKYNFTNFSIPEGKNYYSLEIIIQTEENGIYYATDQLELNVEDPVPPSLSKVELSAYGKNYVIYDMNEFYENVIEYEGNTSWSIKVHFTDRSAIRYYGELGIEIDQGDITENFVELNYFSSDALNNNVSFDGRVDNPNVSFTRDSYTIRIPVQVDGRRQIEDEHGNFRRDSNNNPLPYVVNFQVR